MVIALVAVAALLIICIISLRKFMRDMAIVEAELIKELREMKGILAKINEKQL
ncbi:MAG: hypothetical protein JXB40_05025 [Candidatus Omnitrophica bacterium]|nr:hypothetical protein [Candidatus Omnitrophota bacterium]